MTKNKTSCDDAKHRMDDALRIALNSPPKPCNPTVDEEENPRQQLGNGQNKKALRLSPD